jgi:hypothetical protein
MAIPGFGEGLQHFLDTPDVTVCMIELLMDERTCRQACGPATPPVWPLQPH